MLPDDLVAWQEKAIILAYVGTALSFDYKNWKESNVCGYYVLTYGWNTDTDTMLAVKVPLDDLVEAVTALQEAKALQEHES